MRNNHSAAASTTATSDSTTAISTTTTAVIEDSLFDIKIEMATAGLIPYYSILLLKEVTKENSLTIAKYILAMKTEINLSDHYRQDVIYLLSKLSIFCNNSNNNNNNNNKSKSFKQITRQDILSFLDNYRKPESADPLHKWIGTYNIYRIHFIRFFKWLYYPDIEPNKRPKPQVIENIPLLKRKEESIYKPTDLWSTADDILFLKYCPSKRMKCYHTISRDTSCRPHELLKLRIKDIVFKTAGNYQYAEVLVNGKTGSRHIPLINSIPYVKDWVDEHPQNGNANAILICGFGKSLGRRISTASLCKIYEAFKVELFPKLLQDPNVPSEDKQMIKELLKKPFNPYIRRHSALTEKSKILKENVFRQHCGWSPRSLMHLKYIHYFGNESSQSLLEAYGIVTKDQQLADALKPKQCPNCNEPNKPDNKFCAKCRMVLSYDAYNETLQNQKEKDTEVQGLKEQMLFMQEAQKEIMDLLKNPAKLLEILKEN